MHDRRHARGALGHGDRLVVQRLRCDMAGQVDRGAVDLDVDAGGIGAQRGVEAGAHVVGLQHVGVGRYRHLHGGFARARGVHGHGAGGAGGQGGDGEQAGGYQFDLHGDAPCGPDWTAQGCNRPVNPG